MSHRLQPPTGGSHDSTSRGNTRTRGGPGRHNLGRISPDGAPAAARTCLCCNRPFRSRGPWNRFCGRCLSRREPEPEPAKTYHIPKEWGRSIFSDLDDL